MAKGDSTNTARAHNFGPADPGGNFSRMVHGVITVGGNYATGGYSLDLSGLIPDLALVIIEQKGGYMAAYDYANKKVLVYYADYDAGADGALIQVADNTDISTGWDGARFVAFGY